MTSLPRVKAGLLRHQLDKQVLVYDSKADRVHLLDPTTACVLELIEEGGWTPEGVVAELSTRLGIPSNTGFLTLAVDELRQADLLEIASASAPSGVSRRDLIQKLAIGGASALLIPAVATLSATRAYAQFSGLAQGSQCTAANQCLSGKCCGEGAQPKHCVPNTCEESATSNCASPTLDICCYNGLVCPAADKCGTAAVCAA